MARFCGKSEKFAFFSHVTQISRISQTLAGAGNLTDMALP